MPLTEPRLWMLAPLLTPERLVPDRLVPDRLMPDRLLPDWFSPWSAWAMASVPVVWSAGWLMGALQEGPAASAIAGRQARNRERLNWLERFTDSLYFTNGAKK